MKRKRKEQASKRERRIQNKKRREEYRAPLTTRAKEDRG